MNLALTTLLALAGPAGAAAQVEIRIATTAAKLGEAVEVFALLPPAAALELDLERSATDSFAIMKVDDLGLRREGGPPARVLKLSLLPLALGRLPIDLYWNDVSAGSSAAVDAPSSFALEVAGPPMGEPHPFPVDIKEPRKARRALWPWGLAAALGAALWELYRRRRPAGGLLGAAAPPVDNRPAEVIALSQLDALEASPLWPQGKYKEFYFRLTEVLRRYLEKRFGIPATRLTTSELYRHVRQAELDRPLALLFKDIFDRADLVKFAKILPEAGWGAKDVAGGRSLVAQTTPKDLVKEAAP